MPRSLRPSKKILKKRIKKIVLVLIILGFLYYLFFGSYGFINIFKLKRKESSLRSKKEKLTKEKKALLDSLNQIKKDTFLLEKIAREKLGMIKPGDTVIILEEK